jgi:hypothetical protein
VSEGTAPQLAVVITAVVKTSSCHAQCHHATQAQTTVADIKVTFDSGSAFKPRSRGKSACR